MLGIALIGLSYFLFMIANKLSNKVVIIPIYYQYVILITLLYLALSMYLNNIVFVLSLGAVFIIFASIIIRYIYQGRYIIINSSLIEVSKSIEQQGLTLTNGLYKFSNGNELRVMRNFEGVILDFFQHSYDNEDSRKKLFNSITRGKVIKTKQWYLDITLSIMICVFLCVYIVVR